ncbi:MAG: hypothetical protein V4667_11805 [Bacteroidota bacterium]
MKKYSFILAIILTLTYMTGLAHQDFFTIKDYGNVKVRILTGFKYEEINKAFIIGQLAEKLSSKLNYSEPIFLDFNHHYVDNCIPAYFISYDKGKIKYNHDSSDKEIDFLTKNALIVRQVSRQFNTIATLNLIEYSIKNITSIKEQQQQIEYTENYCQWIINSIDTNLIKKHVKEPASILTNEILKFKIQRPVDDFNIGISYYFQNNSYKLYSKNIYNEITEIISLEYIYDILELEEVTLIFDSDTTFYNIQLNPFGKKIEISSKKTINNKNNLSAYRPFTAESMLFYYLTNKIKNEY